MCEEISVIGDGVSLKKRLKAAMANPISREGMLSVSEWMDRMVAQLSRESCIDCGGRFRRSELLGVEVSPSKWAGICDACWAERFRKAFVE